MGVVEVVKQEGDINLVTACSGSGPAYYLQFMEHMVNSAVARGFTKKQAESLVVQTCLGAAQMAMNSSSDISTLRENVTSKKGVTAEALRVFDEYDLGGIVDKAIEANIIRSEELANEMSCNLD
jgi:pyrroline-5-carboxylate reductase